MELRTVNDLRKVLLEQISLVRSGDTTTAKSNAITNATGKILASIRIEMDYSKATGVKPRIDMMPNKHKK